MNMSMAELSEYNSTTKTNPYESNSSQKKSNSGQSQKQLSSPNIPNFPQQRGKMDREFLKKNSEYINNKALLEQVSAEKLPESNNHNFMDSLNSQESYRLMLEIDGFNQQYQENEQ